MANDAERKWHEKQILDNYKSIHDPLDDKEVTDKKLESIMKKEEISNLQKPVDNNETNGKQSLLINFFQQRKQIYIIIYYN